MITALLLSLRSESGLQGKPPTIVSGRTDVRRGIAFFMIITLLTLAAGCYKTTYVNLYAKDYSIPEDSNPTNQRISGWQHFFLYGLAPGERIIESTKLCGEGYVKEIHTRRTFVQDLLTVITSPYYINIYSPYTGKTVCTKARRKS